jgi:hypothetical protein
VPLVLSLEQCWLFPTDEAACYVEVSIIRVLRQLRYKEVDKNNWFEITKEQLQEALDYLEPWIETMRQNSFDIVLSQQWHLHDSPVRRAWRAHHKIKD